MLKNLLLSLVFFTTYPALSVSVEPTINQQLLTFYNNDQSERKNGQLDSKKDVERLQKVKKMQKEGKLEHPLDFYHAAIIFQHGSEPEDYKAAQELSLQAVKLDPTLANAKWLACAAEDRYLQSIGKPQVWGTQFIITDKWTMDPFDETAKTDEERVAHGVPTLAKIKAYLNKQNANR